MLMEIGNLKAHKSGNVASLVLIVQCVS